MRLNKFLPVVFLLLTACSSGAPAATPILPTFASPNEEHTLALPETGSCKNNFLPIVSGATWNYFSMGGPNGDFAYTDTITEVNADTFILRSQFPQLSLSQKWFCSKDGLLALQLGGGTSASVSMQNMISDFKTIHVSGVSLPHTISPGMQWQYELQMEGSVATPGETTTQSPGTFKLAMQEMGNETITVAAGTFESVKIQATFEAQINVDFQGSLVPYTVNGSSIVWYAPGVGFVKSIENIEFSGTPFTSTTELQSYTIPK